MRSTLFSRRCVSFAALVLTVVGLLTACQDEKKATGQVGDTNNDVQRALSVTSPEPDAVLLSTNVEVTGSAQGIDEVTVNGQAVVVSGGRFTTTLTLAEGLREIVVEGVGVSTVRVPIAIDLNPPVITVTAPAPGLFQEGLMGDQVAVRGTAFDAGSGIDRVEVAGFPIPVRADGTFEADIPLNVGANILDVVAFDRAGRTDSALRGVIYGDFVPWDESVKESLAAKATPAAFDKVAEALEMQVEMGIIDDLLFQYIPESDSFEVTNVSYGEVEVTLTPRDGYLEIVARLHDASIDVHFQQDLTITELDIDGGIDIDPVELYTEVTVAIGPDGLPVISQRNSRILLTNFNLRSSGQLLDFVFDLMEGIARDLVQEALGDLLNDFIIPQIFGPEIFHQQVNFLGQELFFDILLEEMAITSTGLSMVGNVDMPIGPALGIPDSPGVLTTPGQAPREEPERMVRLSIADDFLNKLVFTAWRAGLLNLEVRELIGDGGVLPIDLNVGAISLLVGSELRDQAPSDTPVDIELRPLLPPVAQVGNNGEFPVQLTMADLMLDLYFAPEGGQRTLWATVNVALVFDINARVVNGEVSLDFEIEAFADLVGEPLFELDDQKVETVIASLFESLPGILGPGGLSNIFDLGSVDLFGLHLDQGEIKPAGSAMNYLAVEVDVAVGEQTDGQ